MVVSGGQRFLRLRAKAPAGRGRGIRGWHRAMRPSGRGCCVSLWSRGGSRAPIGFRVEGRGWWGRQDGRAWSYETLSASKLQGRSGGSRKKHLPVQIGSKRHCLGSAKFWGTPAGNLRTPAGARRTPAEVRRASAELRGTSAKLWRTLLKNLGNLRRIPADPRETWEDLLGSPADPRKILGNLRRFPADPRRSPADLRRYRADRRQSLPDPRKSPVDPPAIRAARLQISGNLPGIPGDRLGISGDSR